MALSEMIDGLSDGVKYLTLGYLEYANTANRRAIGDFRDGLKPVHRRILYTLYKGGVWDSFMKSARIAGNVLAYHPHGDTSVYDAAVLMTQKYGGLSVPLIEGQGNFGGVATTDTAANKRYTEMRLHKNARNFFGEMSGVSMVPNFDSTETEPDVLPVKFPNVLVNYSEGMGVGFGAVSVSFNLFDVCGLVKEYIRDGVCRTVIAPDFVTGGEVVWSDDELRSIMTTGQGKIYVRGRIEVGEDAKSVRIVEFPYGKTVQGLLSKIKALDVTCIRGAYDISGFDGFGINVDCMAKSKVDEAIGVLYKSAGLQTSVSIKMMVHVNGIPRLLGVWDIVRMWVTWRREVLRKEYEARLEKIVGSKGDIEALMLLVNTVDVRDKFVDIVVQRGKKAGLEYLRSAFTQEQIADEYLDFCSSRALSVYHDGGQYAKQLKDIKKEIKDLKAWIKDIDSVILRQMDEVCEEFSESNQRRSKIVHDTVLEEVSSVVVKKRVKRGELTDNKKCYYEFGDGFMRKVQAPTGRGGDFVVESTMGGVLMGFDSEGRLLRVYARDFALNKSGEIGHYLPKYFGLDAVDLRWVGRFEGYKTIVYGDGYIGFVDVSEWDGATRGGKIIQRGISKSSAPTLMRVFEGCPDIILARHKSGKVSFVDVRGLEKKHRTSRVMGFEKAKKDPIVQLAVYDGASWEGLLSDGVSVNGVWVKGADGLFK